MKKVHVIFAVMFSLSIMAVLVISPSQSVSQKKTSPVGNPIPEDVAGVLRNSCISCHSERGNEMAMSMWNFSVWDNYSAKKQAKKANAMCNAITKGTMPPASVRNATPERIPTPAQISIVCKWAGSLKLKK